MNIIHDLTKEIFTPSNVADLAKNIPVAISYFNFGKFDASDWTKHLASLKSLFVTYDKDGKDPQIIMYASDNFSPKDIIADINRKDIIPIHASVPVRLPINSIATVCLLGQEIRNTRPELVNLITLFGYITPKPTISYDIFVSEAKMHVSMNGKVKMVNLPDAEGTKRIVIDTTNGTLYALTNTGYVPGMITSDGTVRWGTINTPPSVEFIEDVFKTYTTTRTHTS